MKFKRDDKRENQEREREREKCSVKTSEEYLKVEVSEPHQNWYGRHI
jgi:hypothetical protein